MKKSGKKRERQTADGAKILISPVMLLMAVYFVAMGMAYEFCCSLAAVLLHECAHAAVAKKLGYGLDVIKLMPYGASLCGETDIKPSGEILIAAAGPLANLAVATVFAAVWWCFPSSYMFTQAFCECNLYIGLFNVLPVYPLDGGRIALAALSKKLKRAKAYAIMRVVSVCFGAVAVALFIFTAVVGTPNVCLLSVGLFMVISALIPDRRAQYRELFSIVSRRERVKMPLEIRRYAVSTDAELISLCRTLKPDVFTEFIIVDGGLTRRGRLDETGLIESVKALGYAAKAGEASAFFSSRRENR